MLDIDHFKAINDRHGHPAADQALRRLGDILRDTLRQQGRGSDRGARAQARRRRDATLTASGIRATVSIGIAALDLQDREYSVWIAHADRALYAAKERGRNRSMRYPAA